MENCLNTYVQSEDESSFVIPQDNLTFALEGCKSRRNFAARLVSQLFNPQERASSNCRGVLGKKQLNRSKVKAIYATAMKYYPLQRLETYHTKEREMRQAIDEVCRKTKIVDRENIFQ